MLLHNQRAAQIAWEEYSWEPYGACEVPDEIVPLIKSTGFPVDIVPVPPKEKARRAAEADTESEIDAALAAAKAAQAKAEDVAREAKAAAEAADIRATEVRKEADEANERARVLTEEVRTLRSDAEAFAKLIGEKSTEIAKLNEQLAALQPKQDAKPKAR